MRVHVSLTTISGRVAGLEAVLRSLRAQTLAPERIHLWISPEPFLLDRGVRRADLPDRVLDRAGRGNGALAVHETPNIGPHRKLLPLLERVHGEEDPPLIVTADDDSSYPPRWLEAMVEAWREERCAVAWRARRIRATADGLAPYRTWPLVPRFAEVLSHRLLSTGTDGLLVHPDMLHPAVRGEAYRELCPSRSDAWITGALLAAGTPTLKLSVARALPVAGLPDGPVGMPAFRAARDERPATGLWRFNRSRNDAYLRRTLAHFRRVARGPDPGG